MKIPAAFIFFLLVGNVGAWIDYSLVFTDARIIWFNDTVFANATSWLTKYNRTTTVVNMSTKLLRDLDKDLEIGLHAAEIINNRMRDTPIADARIDLCDFLQHRNKTARYRMINMLYTSLEKYGNFPNLCPFRKGEVYVKNLIIDDDMLPDYIPGDKWRFSLTFYLSNLIIGNGTYTVAVDRTTKLREALIRKLG